MSEAGMAEDSFEIGIVVARRKLKSAWADHAWLPHSALPSAPATEPWTPLRKSGDDQLFYAGSFELRLHPSETSHYRDNLASGRPSLWILLQPVGGDEYEIANVTADPYEGEALTQGMGEIVEAVPMPPEIEEKIAAFFEAHHVERVFFKRKRDRADPDALGRRGRADRLREDQE
jgi:Protein of unknown function (DUF3305)